MYGIRTNRAIDGLSRFFLLWLSKLNRKMTSAKPNRPLAQREMAEPQGSKSWHLGPS